VSTWPAEVALLADLVAIPSVSGAEAAIAAHVADVARGWALDVERDDASVTVRVPGRAAGPVLAFVSHLDTVPAGDGWTRPPFTPTVEDGRLYGRGSGDAKASVAAMLAAARDLAESGGPPRGDVVVLLGYGEETRDTTMPVAVARAGRIDAAVVGEPTNLDFAVAQRGLMMVELVARGDQRHAGASPNGASANAIVALGRALARLPELLRTPLHPLLGSASATPTMLEGGVGRNVTPPVARAVLDVRSTPLWTHAELAEALRTELATGPIVEVLVTSDRLVPCETPAGSPLLAAAERARPQARRFGSPTCSDWVFVRDRDALKCGPGTSSRSHTPDEHVDLAEVVEARTFYRRLAEEYLA
jgi:acetylornithine deacetylase